MGDPDVGPGLDTPGTDVPGLDAPGLDAPGLDAPAADAPPPDGDIVLVDGGILLPDGAIVSCLPVTCGGRLYQCGNCLDDDGDGVTDAADPGCIGACDNSEDVYDLRIPGGDTPTCMIDCYYDEDQGPGNDQCTYDSRCDPLGPDVPACPPDPDGPGVRCPSPLPATCEDVCGPITPNGCDCFGCCELPAGSGSFVFLGSTPEPGHAACSPETVDDPLSCRPCTPNMDCLNTCERCELCLGRDTLPPDCFPPPDAGTPIDAGPFDGGGIDAGGSDAGMPSLRCPAGEQPCGLPGDPACAADFYCLTGCCQFFG